MGNDLNLEKEFLANLDAVSQVAADRVFEKHHKGMSLGEERELKNKLVTLEEKVRYLHALMIQDSKETKKGQNNAILKITLKLDNGGNLELTLDELVSLNKCLIAMNNNSPAANMFTTNWPLPEPDFKGDHKFRTNPHEKESKVDLNPKRHSVSSQEGRLDVDDSTIRDAFGPADEVDHVELFTSNPQCFKAWLATENYIKNKGVKK